MDAESLLAAVAINIGLAFVILSLFSIFKRQPSNADVYYARRISLNDRDNYNIPVVEGGLTFRRFLPSVQWIRDVLEVTDDQILETCGLDALVLIRLFKFGRFDNNRHCRHQYAGS